MKDIKVWCVSYYNSLGYSDSSDLFLTKLEAEIFAENRIAWGCKDVKCFETTDIWGFTANHFLEKITALVDNRTDNKGSCNIWEDDENDETLEDEIQRIAAEVKEIREFSCDLWNTFESPGLDVYALSCAWIYKERLYHYTQTLEVF